MIPTMFDTYVVGYSGMLVPALYATSNLNRDNMASEDVWINIESHILGPDYKYIGRDPRYPTFNPAVVPPFGYRKRDTPFSRI